MIYMLNDFLLDYRVGVGGSWSLPHIASLY